jgi:PrgI family protein
MGQYKVPQNVEAEDKILGSLTFKQLIYTGAGILCGFVFFTLFRGVPVLMIALGLPPTALLLALGLIQLQEQPFETYLIALISFVVKPRKQMWHKDPIVEAFHIEPPKVTVEQARRDPREVRGQLEKLAQIIDTRGWSEKKAAIQEPEAGPVIDPSERIIDAASQVVKNIDVSDIADVELADDILDFQNNPTAQNLEALIGDSERHLREQAMIRMQTAEGRKAAAQHTHAEAPPAPPPQPAVVIPGATPAAPAPAQHTPFPDTSAPLPSAKPQPAPPPTPSGGLTTNPIAAILKLAMDNEQLTVSQLSSQANKNVPLVEGQPISLRHATDSQPTQT